MFSSIEVDLLAIKALDVSNAAQLSIELLVHVFPNLCKWVVWSYFVPHNLLFVLLLNFTSNEFSLFEFVLSFRFGDAFLTPLRTELIILTFWHLSLVKKPVEPAMKELLSVLLQVIFIGEHLDDPLDEVVVNISKYSACRDTHTHVPRLGMLWITSYSHKIILGPIYANLICFIGAFCAKGNFCCWL